MNKLFLVAMLSCVTALTLSCGQQKKTVNKVKEPDLSPDEFRKQCLAIKGRLADGNKMCLTSVTTILPSYDSNRGPIYEIVPSFHAGSYIVATGTPSSSRVDILYDGNFLLSVPGRLNAPTGDGKPLVFYANGAAYKDVSATIWDCYDFNMHRVYCNDGVIP